MEYSKSFCDLVNSFFKEKNDENLKFIGTGNPSAKILIIGKEAALSEKNLSIDFNKFRHSNFGGISLILFELLYSYQSIYQRQNICFEPFLFLYRLCSVFREYH